MRLWHTKAGDIGPDREWCLYIQGYLYTHKTLRGVLWQALTEWKHDMHLVG